MTSALAVSHSCMRSAFGIIRRSDALEVAGMTAGMIDGLLRRGRWEAVQEGIYRVPGGPLPAEQAHLAAVWRAGEGAFLTADPVLGLFGVEGFGLECRPVVLCPRRRRVRGVDFEVRYRPPLPAGQRAALGPIPVATVPRAFVDLALRVRGKRFRVAFDAARRMGLVSSQRLREVAVASLPQIGAQWVIDTADSGVLDQESEPERVVAAIFADYEPALEFQAWVLPRVRVDAVWRDARLVIEYDGVGRHSLPTDREHDRQRRARLRAAGWSVFVVTWEDLQDPSALRARILERRRRRLATLR